MIFVDINTQIHKFLSVHFLEKKFHVGTDYFEIGKDSYSQSDKKQRKYHFSIKGVIEVIKYYVSQGIENELSKQFSSPRFSSAVL